MFQAPRTADEETAFRAEIVRMNAIQAGAATLVLAENEDFPRRAWCFLEICGGVRGLLVEAIPSWGVEIDAYQGIQKWGYLSDQLISALATHWAGSHRRIRTPGHA
jgi:hypothetical protein